jgi:hypothetical protein
MARFPPSDWLVDQFRLTAFPVPGAITRSPEWWEAASGASPDETTSNPKKGSSAVSGSFGPGKLVLRLEPDRVDWLLVPADLDAAALLISPAFPNIGSLAETLVAFSEIAERWLGRDDVPEVGRLAFGAVLRHPEADRRSGYLRVPDYVPVHVDPESSDFLYQINLPITSTAGINGLQINRLSKWSVSAMKLLALVSTGATIAPEPVYAFTLELDINTAPTFAGPLPKARLFALYRELTNLGGQIAAEGIVGR